MEVPGPTALWLCRRYVLRLFLSRFRLPAKKPFPKGVKIPVQSLLVSHYFPVGQCDP